MNAQGVLTLLYGYYVYISLENRAWSRCLSEMFQWRLLRARNESFLVTFQYVEASNLSQHQDDT